MHLLSNDQYKVASPLLSQFEQHTVIKTILSGATPGKVYVDNFENPKITFAQFKHRAYITGDLSAVGNTDLEGFFKSAVLENCREWKVPLFRLSAGSQPWIASISSLLHSLQPIQVPYQCYEYKISPSLPKADIPKDFVIKQVNPELLDSEFEGKDELLDEMCSERESIDAFLENSFGIVAFHSRTLAGWCLSEYNHKNQCEVGIATMPPYQKRGLAKTMTRAFIKLAEDKGIDRILWHCFKSNEASWRTALSAGFELYEEELVLMVYLDRALNDAIHGNLHFEAEDYKEALVWYQKALSQEKPQAWMAWNAACAAAHCGENGLAFDFLFKAMDLGFTNLDYLVQSKHMDPLKEDKRWGEVIVSLNKVIHS